MNFKNYHFLSSRTDLMYEGEKKSTLLYKDHSVSVFTMEEHDFIYRTISLSNFYLDSEIKKVFKQELLFFLQHSGFCKGQHIFVVGLGNDSHTADAVGPKVLKEIRVNSHLFDLGIFVSPVKVSALAPGVLGETGIDTKRIIESIVDEIKPDIVILIDSYVSESIEYLNKTIQISNAGVTPGSGLKRRSLDINSDSLCVPVIVIGVPTAIEVDICSKTKRNSFPFLLSTSDVDCYVEQISKIIGQGMNEVFYDV